MPLESINQNYIYRRMINNTIIVNINCASISIFELEDLLKDIDILRKQLNELINKKTRELSCSRSGNSKQGIECIAKSV